MVYLALAISPLHPHYDCFFVMFFVCDIISYNFNVDFHCIILYGHPGVERILKFYNYHSKLNNSCNKKLFYLHVSHCIRMYTLSYKNISRSICDVCVYIYIHTYACVFLYIYIYIYHTHIYIYTILNIYVYIHIIHIYIYMFIIAIYTFIYIYIYIYMCVCVGFIKPLFIWPHPFSNLR